jgi:poly-gamma-glutamate capsule biosynthesis protein CapA/YwtB (metallophosphatase superfamily)
VDFANYGGLSLRKAWIGGVLAALLLLTGCRPRPTLEITFGGDIMLAREGQALFNANPWSDFGAELETRAENLFFANLESPLIQGGVPVQTGGYNLCADVEQIELLKEGRISLVSTANNHQGDCGQPETSGSFLEKQGILSVNLEMSPVYVDTQVGVVGVIAADAVGEPLDLDVLLKQVGRARERCDILIVSLHWGFEYAVEPNDLQREWAKKLSDAGVDVLWGHHPHVLQPVEWITTAEGDHRMLAMYSLGNLLTDQSMTWETQHSALLSLRFTPSGVASISVYPIHMDPASKKLSVPSTGSIERIKNRLGFLQ